MINLSRRGFFGMVLGVVVAPFVPIPKVIQQHKYLKNVFISKELLEDAKYCPQWMAQADYHDNWLNNQKYYIRKQWY